MFAVGFTLSTIARRMRIRVFSDATALAEAAAVDIARWLTIDDSRSLGLAGGSTPRPTYELLRDMTVPWERVTAWMTDERHVPIDDPASNAGMARRALFDHVPATLHAVPYTENPNDGAQAYEDTLRAFMGESLGRIQPGLVVLGVGADGHTASLFPGTPALEEQERDYVANWVEGQNTWRLTATLPLLARARRTVFIVSGESKAGIVAEILEGESDHPAAIVNRVARDSVWLLDHAAAADLSTT
jgi:6-phosphogluconolactonase